MVEIEKYLKNIMEAVSLAEVVNQPMMDEDEQNNHSSSNDNNNIMVNNAKVEKLARQKARTSIAMRRGTTRVQSPFEAARVQSPFEGASHHHPTKVTFTATTTTSHQQKAVDGQLDRHLEKWSAASHRTTPTARDEQSVVSTETGSDIHSIVSKSDASDSRKLRPTRPRRAKKMYPPPIDPHHSHHQQQHNHHSPNPDENQNSNHDISGNATTHQRQEGLKRNLHTVPTTAMFGLNSPPHRDPLSCSDLANVKCSLEKGSNEGTGPIAQHNTSASSSSTTHNLPAPSPLSLRQKIKEQQKTQKRLVLQSLTASKVPQDPDGSKTESENSMLEQLDQKRSRYTKVSNALQRKRPVLLPTKTSTSNGESVDFTEKQNPSVPFLDVALTASESASSANPSPVSLAKPEPPETAVIESTKRMAVLAAARRTKIQNSPSKHASDGSFSSHFIHVPDFDAASVVSSSSRLSVYATPTRATSKPRFVDKRQEDNSSSSSFINASTRSLDTDKRKSSSSSSVNARMHGMNPSSLFASHATSSSTLPSSRQNGRNPSSLFASHAASSSSSSSRPNALNHTVSSRPEAMTHTAHSSSSSSLPRPDPPAERVTVSLPSPSLSRASALQKLSFDPALKRFQRGSRPSTGSSTPSSSLKQQEEDPPHGMIASERVTTPSPGSAAASTNHCRKDSPSMSRSQRRTSSEKIRSPKPKLSVGDVAVGDIIDVFLYQSANKSSKETTKASSTDASRSSSFKPSSTSRISESGKISRNSDILARGSEKAKQAVQRSGSDTRKIGEPTSTTKKKKSMATTKTSALDEFGLPPFTETNLTISTAWEPFN